MKSILIMLLIVFGVVQCFFWWLSVLIDNGQKSFSPWGAVSILVCMLSLWLLMRQKGPEETNKKGRS